MEWEGGGGGVSSGGFLQALYDGVRFKFLNVFRHVITHQPGNTALPEHPASSNASIAIKWLSTDEPTKSWKTT